MMMMMIKIIILIYVEQIDTTLTVSSQRCT